MSKLKENERFVISIVPFRDVEVALIFSKLAFDKKETVALLMVKTSARCVSKETHTKAAKNIKIKRFNINQN